VARIADYLEQMRPKQWFKSLYIAIGAAPAILLTPPLPLLIIPLLAYGIVNMILLQGVMYVVNDVADIENDRNHPEKSKRPIASGRIGPSAAYAFALSLFVIATVSAFFIDKRIVIIDFILFGLAMAYSLRPLRLRDRAYWDVGIAAINFPLRVAVGWFLFEPYNIARLTLGMQFEGTSIAGETISKLLFGLSPQAIDMTVRFSTVTLSFAGMIAATYLLAVFLLSMKRLG
jgi:4-hydroxybenzoate polyprenyltransferase